MKKKLEAGLSFSSNFLSFRNLLFCKVLYNHFWGGFLQGLENVSFRAAS